MMHTQMYLAASASALRSSRVVRGTMSSKGFHSTSEPVIVGALMGLSFSPTCMFIQVARVLHTVIQPWHETEA